MIFFLSKGDGVNNVAERMMGKDGGGGGVFEGDNNLKFVSQMKAIVQEEWKLADIPWGEAIIQVSRYWEKKRLTVFITINNWIQTKSCVVELSHLPAPKHTLQMPIRLLVEYLLSEVQASISTKRPLSYTYYLFNLISFQACCPTL